MDDVAILRGHAHLGTHIQQQLLSKKMEVVDLSSSAFAISKRLTLNELDVSVHRGIILFISDRVPSFC